MKRLFLILNLILGLSLAGCQRQDQSSVEDYVGKIKSGPIADPPPLPEVNKFRIYEYTASHLRNPFVSPRFDERPSAPVEDIGEEESVVQEEEVPDLPPDADRPRELLESYPLDTLSMVGTLQRGAEVWGLITDSSGFIHKVQVGNYLGQNSGKIQRITAETIYIEELVRDPEGGWYGREAALKIKQ